MKIEDMQFNEVSQRYLKGLLTPEESIDFENYILDKPELIEQLEMDSVLYKTMSHVKTKSQKNFFLKGFSRFLIPASGFAVFALVGFSVWVNFVQLESVPERTAESMAVTELIFLTDSKWRSLSESDSSEHVDLVIKKNKKVTLSIPIEEFSGERFDIEIRNKIDNSKISSYSNIEPTMDGYVSLHLSTFERKHESFVIEVLNSKSRETEERYIIKIE